MAAARAERATDPRAVDVLQTSMICGVTHFLRLSAAAHLHNLPVSLISHRMPFDEVLDGLKVAATPQSAKVMIEFEEA